MRLNRATIGVLAICIGWGMAAPLHAACAQGQPSISIAPGAPTPEGVVPGTVTWAFPQDPMNYGQMIITYMNGVETEKKY